MTGKIHSIQTLGTLDGPGVRFVAFLQGCNLRCGCCHNPDTWECAGGTVWEAAELVKKATRYRTYFGPEGGVTLSGGEPLLQAGFAAEVFALCHKEGLGTCLDTSGSVWNADVERLLSHTDRVLLDIKYPTDAQYREYVGCGIERPLAFLRELNARGIPVTLRQVTIPTLNDTEESVDFLSRLARENPCVDGVELLPFKKICKVKYDNMGLDFRFDCFDTPDPARVAALQAKIVF